MDSDGTWAKPSNMSWHYSYTFAAHRNDPGECFWLDHRGDLRHRKDLEEEYIGTSIKDMGREPNEGWMWPKYLWASEVLPEAGIPEGDRLTDGMRENGVMNTRFRWGLNSLPLRLRQGIMMLTLMT